MATTDEMAPSVRVPALLNERFKLAASAMGMTPSELMRAAMDACARVAADPEREESARPGAPSEPREDGAERVAA
jgi:hypothetical protein